MINTTCHVNQKMTTFGWKRKSGENISKDVSQKFLDDSEVDFTSNDTWLKRFKRRKKDDEENRRLKCEEFKTEGVRLAELNRFEDAVKEWDKALNLMPRDEKILEMKAQALLQLNTPFPALQAAERAVKVNPQWWVAYQTLGRTQLGIGDLKMAKISFSKAIHLNPSETELWEEDLKWTLSLIEEKAKLDAELLASEKELATETKLS
ncbi:tetratricopeptide repeat protein 33 [Trichonephila inaurata madagascariensis]|uniref:Tetratricopeptide repeat protein 33 n=1 Tax=Trichonephila inaurata madagascariensis TaxID=2747483 RepID=A0A8X6Y0F5_9ARAC|nr:tetratricopeptide repeat protein 33 [Trichonephila inaurata madagascariensis]